MDLRLVFPRTQGRQAAMTAAICRNPTRYSSATAAGGSTLQHDTFMVENTASCIRVNSSALSFGLDKTQDGEGNEKGRTEKDGNQNYVLPILEL